MGKSCGPIGILMRGVITIIDSADNAVVVEVILGEKPFTVSGPLSSGVVLRRGRAPANLTDFVVGDQVTVKWRATDYGHIIQMLEAR